MRQIVRDSEEDVRGLKCWHCGCHHFRLIHMRPVRGGKIMRRRECRNCGSRITTRDKAN